MNNSKKAKFESLIKANINPSLFVRKEKLKEFTKMIEENPDLLSMLSSERLDILIEYYGNIILENERKIRKFKKNEN